MMDTGIPDFDDDDVPSILCQFLPLDKNLPYHNLGIAPKRSSQLLPDLHSESSLDADVEKRDFLG